MTICIIQDTREQTTPSVINSGRREISKGYCQCGCGKKTRPKRRFIDGHRVEKWDRSGVNNPNWKGGNRAFGKKYRMQFVPEHPRACKNYVLEHRLIAEKALGKPLPINAVVHHHTSEQLVICQDRAYHNFIHRRMRAFYACGHANWKKCNYCKVWGDPETENMYVNKTGMAHHRECDNAAHVQARLIKKKINK